MSCSAASWRIVADGVICGLGGCKIASRCGAHQEGNVAFHDRLQRPGRSAPGKQGKRQRPGATEIQSEYKKVRSVSVAIAGWRYVGGGAPTVAGLLDGAFARLRLGPGDSGTTAVCRWTHLCWLKRRSRKAC